MDCGSKDVLATYPPLAAGAGAGAGAGAACTCANDSVRLCQSQLRDVEEWHVLGRHMEREADCIRRAHQKHVETFLRCTTVAQCQRHHERTSKNQLPVTLDAAQPVHPHPYSKSNSSIKSSDTAYNLRHVILRVVVMVVLSDRTSFWRAVWVGRSQKIGALVRESTAC
jgi:hypothetical protein